MVLRSSHVSIAAVFLMLVLAPAPSHGEQAGALWESTSEMSMEGMPMKMPAQTVKICAAKEWTRPPAGGDRNCTNSDFKKVGSKATWTVRCTGEVPMTGAGEMTFAGNDSYTGSVKFTGGEMPMTVKLNGRKIGGCDNPQ
jgi:hypothetical protein